MSVQPRSRTTANPWTRRSRGSRRRSARASPSVRLCRVRSSPPWIRWWCRVSKWLRLGDLISIQRGTTYKSALLDQPGPALLGLASIERNGGFRKRSLRTYGGDSPPQLLVRPGEIYASLKDVTQSADLLGSVARLPTDVPIGRLTQDTVRLDVVSSEIDADYLYWCLRTPQCRQYCRSRATGTTNLGLPRDDFLAFELPPPTAERVALVRAL